MSKFLIAALILALLFAGCLLCAARIDRLTRSIALQADEVCACAVRGETDEAVSAAEAAEKCWRDAAPLLGAVLRHSETDKVEDAFCALFEALYADDPAAVRGAVRRLQMQLRAVTGMERVAFGTVF